MAQTLTIRIARASDLAAVDALLSRSYPRLLKGDYPPSLQVTALPLLSRANPRLLASGTYFVAEAEGGALVGAGGWSPVGPQGGRTRGVGHVRHVATDPAHTRRGVAWGLMLRAVGQARGMGLRVLDCMSTRTAVPFYAALGFREVGPAEVALRPGIVFPAVRMILRL